MVQFTQVGTVYAAVHFTHWYSLRTGTVYAQLVQFTHWYSLRTGTVYAVLQFTQQYTSRTGTIYALVQFTQHDRLQFMQQLKFTIRYVTISNLRSDIFSGGAVSAPVWHWEDWVDRQVVQGPKDTLPTEQPHRQVSGLQGFLWNNHIRCYFSASQPNSQMGVRLPDKEVIQHVLINFST